MRLRVASPLMRAHHKTEKAITPSKVRGELLTNVMGQVQNVLGFFFFFLKGGGETRRTHAGRKAETPQRLWSDLSAFSHSIVPVGSVRLLQTLALQQLHQNETTSSVGGCHFGYQPTLV